MLHLILIISVQSVVKKTLRKLYFVILSIYLHEELVSKMTTITGLSEGSNDSRVVQLLGLIDVSTTRDSRSMRVSDILNVGCQHPGDIAFLNPHVIDIMQELQIG
jgi:hypothetical protein